MIRIGEKTILLLFPDGRSVPFDPAALQERLALALTDYVDPKDREVARDLAAAVEMALLNRFRQEETPCIKAESLDEMICRILAGAGFKSAAEAFQRASILSGSDFARIPRDRIRTFLAENLDLEENALERIVEKVDHTMQSIGADDSSPALALELAKHFLTVSARSVSFHVDMPDFTPDRAFTILPEDLLSVLSGEARACFEKRILKVQPVNLKIFPALRISLRLSGLAMEEQLCRPLTEMALLPGMVRVARIVDEVCLAADDLFRGRGFAKDLPAKVLLHLADGSIFTHDWMDCTNPRAQERCAVNLCRMFASEMTRVPVKLSCN